MFHLPPNKLFREELKRLPRAYLKRLLEKQNMGLTAASISSVEKTPSGVSNFSKQYHRGTTIVQRLLTKVLMAEEVSVVAVAVIEVRVAADVPKIGTSSTVR